MLFEVSTDAKIHCLTSVISALSRVGNDLVIDARPKYVTLRALNATQSALPVLQMSAPYFDRYEYLVGNSQIACQVEARWVVAALRTPPRGVAVTFRIDDENQKLTVTCKTPLEVERTWIFFFTKATVYNAVVDSGSVAVTVRFRCDVLDTRQMFRGVESLMLACRKSQPKRLVITSPELDGTVLSTLAINHTDLCDVAFSEDAEEVALTLNCRDFQIGIALASVLSQRAEMELIGPGSPAVIRAKMANVMSLQIALATTDVPAEYGRTTDLPSPDRVTTKRTAPGPVYFFDETSKGIE